MHREPSQNTAHDSRMHALGRHLEFKVEKYGDFITQEYSSRPVPEYCPTLPVLLTQRNCSGGESTAMALIGERWGLFPRLKRWIAEGRPVWGTCAGMILLSDHALMTKQGGQSLVGGLDVEVCRNYFGAQKSSFEIPLDTAALKPSGQSGGECSGKSEHYPAVFIRAPAILEVGPDVEVLCKVKAWPCKKACDSMQAQLQQSEKGIGENCSANTTKQTAQLHRMRAIFRQQPPAALGKREREEGNKEQEAAEAPEVIVAVRKENLLATAFHPELTDDTRWHQYFLTMVKEAVVSTG
ncbi:unnamed protein product [Discosporangium mesarthrocarpum]